LRRLLTPYVLVGIGAVLLIAIGTALATSFDGPEDDGKLRASLQEDTTTPMRRHARKTGPPLKKRPRPKPAKKADKAKKGSRKADKSGRKTNKAQKQATMATER